MNATNQNATLPTATVSAHLLAAAYRFAAKKDVRFYLNGVRVEPAPDGEGVLLIATDGHRMAVLRDALGSCSEPVTLPHTKRAAPSKRDGDVMATFTAGRVSWSDGLSAAAELVEGRFPDWGQVIPMFSAPASTALCMNPNYLADLVAISAAYGEKRPAVALSTAIENGAVLCKFECDALAVIMPLRSALTQNVAQPAWLSFRAPVQAAEPQADEAPPVQAAEPQADEAPPVQSSAPSDDSPLSRALAMMAAKMAARVAPIDEAPPVQAIAQQIDEAPPVQAAALKYIDVERVEGDPDSAAWPAGETRRFHGVTAWDEATAALEIICSDVAPGMGYDKTDITATWENGESFRYCFAALHPVYSRTENKSIAAYVREAIESSDATRARLEAVEVPSDEAPPVQAIAPQVDSAQPAQSSALTADQLRALHPDLLPRSDPHAVQKNIRKMLSAAGIKGASVRRERGSMMDSVVVNLAAGTPSALIDEARQIARRFLSGSFESMDDSYTYRSTPFTQAFGSARYVEVYAARSESNDSATPVQPNDSAPPVQPNDSAPPVQPNDSAPPVLPPAPSATSSALVIYRGHRSMMLSASARLASVRRQLADLRSPAAIDAANGVINRALASVEKCRTNAIRARRCWSASLVRENSSTQPAAAPEFSRTASPNVAFVDFRRRLTA